MRRKFWVWLVILLWLTACGRAKTLPNPSITPRVVAPVTPTPVPIVAIDPKATPLTENQLVIWAPNFFEARADANTGSLLQAVYRQFEQANPGVHVDVHVKAESGEASMFNYLRTAQRVAPTILPDLVLIDTQYLWQVAELDLIHPITFDDLGQKVNFYPFALNAVTFKQQQYGIPYTADLIHAVYDSQVYTTTPVTWDAVLAKKRPYLFSTGIRDGFYDESLLLQYIGAGGQLLESGELSNPEAVEALFTFLSQGRSNGTVPEEVLNLSNLNAVWAAFLLGQTGVANISTSLYLSQPKSPDDIKFGPVPTRKGANITIARTWAFAILTNDPQRRQLALQLIARFLEPIPQGQWSQLASYLPVSPDAFAQWTTTGPYHDFLRQQLEIAVAIPGGRPFAEFAKHLQAAQQTVLSGQGTVKEALAQLQTKP